jgi:hypothetical protein
VEGAEERIGVLVSEKIRGVIQLDRERFSHELTLVFSNGKTQILTHEKKESP